MEVLISGLIPGLIILAVLYRIFAGFFRGPSSDPVSREYLGLPQKEDERERLRTTLERRAQQRQRQAQEALQRGDVASSAWRPEPWEEQQAPELGAQHPPAEEPAPSSPAPPSREPSSPPVAAHPTSWDAGRASPRGGRALKGRLASRRGLRQAILVREVLGTPRGQQPLEEERL